MISIFPIESSSSHRALIVSYYPIKHGNVYFGPSGKVNKVNLNPERSTSTSRPFVTNDVVGCLGLECLKGSIHANDRGSQFDVQ